jgi:ABC-type Fe3+-hydroxamate transport system substrate-binding protein
MRRFIVGCLLLLLVLLGYQQYRLSRTSKETNQGRQRYISLSPTLTEILFELGAGKDLVAVTTYCVYPEEAKAKEKIGDFVNPNFEKIVGLKPDVIFAETWSSSKMSQRSRALTPSTTSTRRYFKWARVWARRAEPMRRWKA